MTRAELAALAKAATPGPWEALDDYPQWIVADDANGRTTRVASTMQSLKAKENAAYIAALSPEVVLRMLAVIDAAVAMRFKLLYWGEGSAYESAAFDAALSALAAERAP